MKKIILSSLLIMCAVSCFAQAQLAFPFQGGSEVMTRFFDENVQVSEQIISKKATGTVVFKFTADTAGAVNKIIIYYADDLVLVTPLIDALKKSEGKWVIPFREKMHDFIITFNVGFIPPATGGAALQKAVYEFYKSRRPMVSANQVPLDMATLLPTIVVNYKLN